MRFTDERWIIISSILFLEEKKAWLILIEILKCINNSYPVRKRNITGKRLFRNSMRALPGRIVWVYRRSLILKMSDNSAIMHQVYTLLYGILKMCAFVFQNWQNKVARNEKSLMSFRIPKIWQIFKRFTRAFHQA